MCCCGYLLVGVEPPGQLQGLPHVLGQGGGPPLVGYLRAVRPDALGELQHLGARLALHAAPLLADPVRVAVHAEPVQHTKSTVNTPSLVSGVKHR